MKHQLLKKTAINSRTLLLINLNREKEMEGNQDKQQYHRKPMRNVADGHCLNNRRANNGNKMPVKMVRQFQAANFMLAKIITTATIPNKVRCKFKRFSTKWLPHFLHLYECGSPALHHKQRFFHHRFFRFGRFLQ